MGTEVGELSLDGGFVGKTGKSLLILYSGHHDGSYARVEVGIIIRRRVSGLYVSFFIYYTH